MRRVVLGAFALVVVPLAIATLSSHARTAANSVAGHAGQGRAGHGRSSNPFPAPRQGRWRATGSHGVVGTGTWRRTDHGVSVSGDVRDRRRHGQGAAGLCFTFTQRGKPSEYWCGYDPGPRGSRASMPTRHASDHGHGYAKVCLFESGKPASCAQSVRMY